MEWATRVRLGNDGLITFIVEPVLVHLEDGVRSVVALKVVPVNVKCAEHLISLERSDDCQIHPFVLLTAVTFLPVFQFEVSSTMGACFLIQLK